MADLITLLNAWLEVVREEDINRELLVIETQALVTELQTICVALPGDEWPKTLHPQFSEAHHIIRAVIDLAGRFLWNDYTDSDTDGPCDIEWDVHHLQKDLDPTYTIPADVEPAYVLATVYPTPEEEDE